jgi:hypothetical protein
MGRRTQRWEPPAETLSHFPAVSGNTVNGLGEAEPRPPMARRRDRRAAADS